MTTVADLGPPTELRRGIIKAWDAATWTATLAIDGSLTTWLRTVPVSRAIASAEMVVGRKVAVALFDPANDQDAVVVAVYT